MRGTIKTVKPSDIDNVMAMGRALHLESRYRHIPFDESVVAETFLNLHHQDDVLFSVFACIADKPVGIMCAIKTNLYFSSKKFTSDLLFYVKPEARGGTSALNLIRSYTSWAQKDPDVAEIQLGVTTGIAEDKTAGFLKKLGYSKSGEQFVFMD
jgi:hypothetical protein